MDKFDGPIPEYKTTLICVYKLIHRDTGKFYIGSTTNYYQRRMGHISLLRRNKHPVKTLQNLYNESPHFIFEIDSLGSGVKDPEVREKAYDREQELLDANKDNLLCLNRSSDSRRVVLEGQAMLDLLRNRALAFKRPEVKAKKSLASTNNWKDPIIRAKQMATRNTPEFLRNHIESQPTAKKVVVAGQEFLSIKNASIVLHMSRATIKQRLKDPQFHDYYFTDSIT